MNFNTDETPKTQTEFSGSGGGRSNRPTAAGLGEFGRESVVPDIGALKKVDGVLGSVVIGHDGILIASDLPDGMEEKSIGVWALGIYMNSEHVMRKMGLSRLYEIVSKSADGGYTIIAACGSDLIVTLYKPVSLDEVLIPVMAAFTKMLADSTKNPMQG